MKRTVKLSELINNQHNHVDSDITQENIESVKNSYPIHIDLIHILENEELVGAANELGDALETDVLVYEIDEGMGGGGDNTVWIQLLHQWPTIIALSNAFTILQQINTLRKALPSLLKFFKAASNGKTPRPPIIKYAGPNNSWIEFRFFYFFDDEEYTDGVNAIPEAYNSAQFANNQDVLMIFDPKQKKWFIEGIRHHD